jgi:hypothetical protein
MSSTGSTSGCPSATLLGGYGTHLVKTYCLPDKEAIKGVYSVLMNALASNGQFV